VLWSITGVTFVYDGVVVGSANIVLTDPMYLLMENRLGGPSAPGVGVSGSLRLLLDTPGRP
jgi:hypothetical protein